MATFAVSPLYRDVIGVGMKSPFGFSVGKGVKTIATSNGLDKITDSIRTILQTRPGERFNQPEFGSRLYDLTFEPNDQFTHQLVYYYTVNALTRWERRIKITNVSFLTDDSNPYYIGIKIDFYVLQTHQQGSYVFPFERRTMPMSSAVTGVEAQRIFTPGKVLELS